jgi:uncharacterized protein YbjT (DUF2867 family)
MRILIIGATGLVGRELVTLSAERSDVSRVVALVRRDPGARPSPKVLYRVVDFEALGEGLDDAFAVDTVLCAMGTTARATPDPVRYREIEVEIPLAVARRARAAGATRFGLVSSVGASPTARSTYLRQKGELEEALQQMGWERLVVARPSVLRGARDEFRLGERIGLLLGGLLPGAYKPVDAEQVAAALLRVVMLSGPKVEVLDNVTLRSGLT